MEEDQYVTLYVYIIIVNTRYIQLSTHAGQLLFFPFYLKKKKEKKWLGGYALSSQTLITSNRWQ